MRRIRQRKACAGIEDGARRPLEDRVWQAVYNEATASGLHSHLPCPASMKRCSFYFVGPLVALYVAPCPVLFVATLCPHAESSASPVEAVAAENAEPASGIKRTKRDVSGWTVLIDRRLLDSEEQTAKTETALRLLKKQLDEIIEVVPAPAVAKMKQVTLYFSPPYPSHGQRAEYHPGAGWLEKNGRDPVMVRCVEFTNINRFEEETRRMPNFALHELAHAYHHRFCERGFGNEAIKNAYERALASGSYNSVDRQDSKGRLRKDRAYAMTNPQEYFAETTEAFFSKNDFFPFNRQQLEAHDPAVVVVLDKIWKQN